jgi:hypothetical protein
MEPEVKSNDFQIYRVRRTLTAVKRKLEEALSLSRHNDEIRHDRPAAARRHR